MGDKKNVVVAGPIRVLTAVAGTELPADTVAYGASWGEAWTDRGLTDGGASLEEGIERAFQNVDQFLHPVSGDATTAEAKMTVRMAESILTNIRLARGVGAAVESGADSDVLDGSSTAGENDTPIAIAVEGRAPGSTPGAPLARRVVLYEAVGGGVPTISYTVGDKQMVEAEFTGLVCETVTGDPRAWRKRDLKATDTTP
jgi:hypothetical protein